MDQQNEKLKANKTPIYGGTLGRESRVGLTSKKWIAIHRSWTSRGLLTKTGKARLMGKERESNVTTATVAVAAAAVMTTATAYFHFLVQTMT